MALSDYLESSLLNHLFRGAEFSKPSTIAVALTSTVPVGSHTGQTMPEIPSGVAAGLNFISTNYKRVNLGDPAATGNSVWNGVGVDDTTIFSVYGTSSSGASIGISGFFYPLYLDQPTALAASNGYVQSYAFEEYPSVTFYAPTNLQQSGVATDPGYTQYDGNGFIKNASQIVFDTALTDWGWVSGIALVDSSAHGSGNVLFSGRLANPRFVYTGDNIKFDINSLEISLK